MGLFIPATEIAQIATDFLVQHHPSLEAPVPIDEIIEFRLGLDLVPVMGMLQQHRIDGFLTSDLTSIYIDLERLTELETNYRGRMTLAHEVGHLVLHPEYIRSKRIATVHDWKKLVIDNADEHDKYEQQARIFGNYLMMPVDYVTSAFENTKQKMEQMWTSVGGSENKFPKKDEIAGYAARELARDCHVSEQAAQIRLSKWVQNDL